MEFSGSVYFPHLYLRCRDTCLPHRRIFCRWSTLMSTVLWAWQHSELMLPSFNVSIFERITTHGFKQKHASYVGKNYNKGHSMQEHVLRQTKGTEDARLKDIASFLVGPQPAKQVWVLLLLAHSIFCHHGKNNRIRQDLAMEKLLERLTTWPLRSIRIIPLIICMG